MIEKDLIELIHKEIDGVNSPEESARLKALLKNDQEAKTLFSELNSVADILNHVEQRDPPPSLKRNIMNAVRPKIFKHGARKRFPESIVDAIIGLRAKFNFKYAFAFAAGAIAGIALLVIFSDAIHENSLQERANYYGSILFKEDAGKLTPANELGIRLNDVRGNVRLKTTKGMAWVELAIESPGKVEIVFEFNADSLSFVGFANLSAVPRSFVTTYENKVGFKNIGENLYILLFKMNVESPPALRIEIGQSSKIIYKKNLTFRRESVK